MQQSIGSPVGLGAGTGTEPPRRMSTVAGCIPQSNGFVSCSLVHGGSLDTETMETLCKSGEISSEQFILDGSTGPQTTMGFILKKLFARVAAAAVMAVASLSAHAAFDITINYTGDAQYRPYFTAAENFWESAITGYQSGINLTGFTINASIGAIDGQWGTLGYAGPVSASHQGGYWLTTAGDMVFDQADISYMSGSGSFGDVIRHEMGHVIGIGTLWTNNSVYVDGSGKYTGAAGLAMYRAEFNQPGATYIPVELGGGSGTADGHWNEVDNGAGPTGVVDSQGRDMQNELMTGWLNAPTFASRTTVASLQDIGYTVNLNAVNPVPEPETMLLFALGLPVVARFARRRPVTAA